MVHICAVVFVIKMFQNINFSMPLAAKSSLPKQANPC